MKQIKALILALALLAPQPAQAGWWETISNWFVDRKNAALCLVGIGAACAIAYRIYTAPRRSANELNMLGAREKLVVTTLDDLKKKIKLPENANRLQSLIRTETDTLLENLDASKYKIDSYLLKNAATIQEQAVNREVNRELNQLDPILRQAIGQIVIAPLDELSAKEIKEEPVPKPFMYIKTSLTPAEAIAKVEEIKQSFLTEMRKLKSPGSTPLKQEPAQTIPDKDKEEL